MTYDIIDLDLSGNGKIKTILAKQIQTPADRAVLHRAFNVRYQPFLDKLKEAIVDKSPEEELGIIDDFERMFETKVSSEDPEGYQTSGTVTYGFSSKAAISKFEAFVSQRRFALLGKAPKSISTSVLFDPKIFTSARGFQIFEAFKNEIITEKTEYADYSFLFDKLKKDEFIHDMRHKTFIDFLSKSYNAKFTSTYKQFKYSETDHKKKTYKRYKNQFQ